MIEVRLFGELQHYAPAPAPHSGVMVNLASEEDGTLETVLLRLGIDPVEVGSVFLNGRLLPRSTYPITLGYPLAANHPLTAEVCLKVAISAGDRLGVFSQSMSLFVV